MEESMVEEDQVDSFKICKITRLQKIHVVAKEEVHRRFQGIRTNLDQCIWQLLDYSTSIHYNVFFGDS